MPVPAGKLFFLLKIFSDMFHDGSVVNLAFQKILWKNLWSKWWSCALLSICSSPKPQCPEIRIKVLNLPHFKMVQKKPEEWKYNSFFYIYVKDHAKGLVSFYIYVKLFLIIVSVQKIHCLMRKSWFVLLQSFIISEMSKTLRLVTCSVCSEF